MQGREGKERGWTVRDSEVGRSRVRVQGCLDGSVG